MSAVVVDLARRENSQVVKKAKTKKKQTALHSQFKAHSRGRRGMDWRMILPVVTGVALVGIIIFGSRLFTIYSDYHAQLQVERKQEWVATALEEYFDQNRKEVEEIASSANIQEVLERGEVDGIRRAENRLGVQYSRYLRLNLVSWHLGSLRAELFPGLSYGVLDMLRDAKQSTKPSPAEVHLYDTNSRHVNFVSRVYAESGDAVGFVVASLPVAQILEIFKKAEVAQGYLELRQGRHEQRDLTLAGIGRSVLASEAMANARDVSGTRLWVGGVYQPGFTLVGINNVSVVVVGLLSSIFMLVGIAWMRKRVGWPELLKRREVVLPEAALAPDIPVAKPRDALAISTNEEQSMSRDDVPDARAESPAEVSPSMFRAYDIRGIVGETLGPEVAHLIGLAIGSEARSREQNECVVARDGRHSGGELVASLIDGLRATGVNVVDIGAVPTGVLYFATHHLKTGTGVMVTGSHNPPDYNGFKVMIGGETLAEGDITALYERIRDMRFVEGVGGVQEMDIVEEYIDRIAEDVQLDEPLRVVVDAGNGIAGAVAPELLGEIGCEVIPLYCDVDGDFPNHHPDPSEPKNMRDLVLSVKQLNADLGIAFDGDGDRLGVVSNDGEIIYSDRLLMLFAEDVLSRNPGGVVIYDVKCTRHLAERILGHGGSPLMWKTGHSLIKRKMKETKAQLGGEMSGHFFFQERWFGFDCGIYAAARLLEILATQGRTATEVFADLPSGVSTPELKITLREGENMQYVQAFADTAHFDGAKLTLIDGVRADFSDGWGLVRGSNTTPVLVLRFEADNGEALERIQAAFREQMLAVREDLELPF